MAEWYYTKNGQQQGPVNDADLKRLATAGKLLPSDMIWKDGMTNWVPASAVKGLFAAGAAGGTGSSGVQKPVSKPAPAAPPSGGFDDKGGIGEPPKKKGKGLLIGLIGGGVVLFCCCFPSIIGGVIFMMGGLGGGSTLTVPFDKEDKLAKGSEKDYAVKFEANKTYVIDLKSKEFDAYLKLKDPAGTVVAENDDYGGTLDSHIEYKAPKEGTYTIVATSLGKRGGGTFKLSCKVGSSGSDDQEGGDGRKNGGDSGSLDVKGKLTTGQPKMHKVKLEGKQNYVMDLKSNDFDPMLTLRDPKGDVVAMNDDVDPPNNLNSRIEYRTKTSGTYTLIVAPVPGNPMRPKTTGNYHLTVKAQ